jgi:Amt family ammonium transporter
VVFLNTAVAGAAGLLAWALVERIRLGSASSMGAASGLISALVAITPACGAVSPLGALAIGLIAGAACSLAIELKFRLGFDDSLDVVGVHLVGGLVGTLLVGFFATASAPAGVDGLFYGGGADQLWRQAVGAVAVLTYSFVLSLILAYIVKAVTGLRVSDESEVAGIDEGEHAETGYDFSSLRASGGLSSSSLPPAKAPAEPVTAGKEG